MNNLIIYLLLGGNEGDRLRSMQRAATLIGERCGTVLRASPVYETAAWGKEDQPPFLNQVLEITSTLSAEELLKGILEIERSLGRQRTVRWGQRTLDIDILFYGDRVIYTDQLTIPHPHLQERRFTLVPLCMLAPGFVHPVLRLTVAELLEQCKDPLPVTLV